MDGIASGEYTADRSATKRHEVVVVGGGQAGLSIGYFLAQHESGMMFSFNVDE